MSARAKTDVGFGECAVVAVRGLLVAILAQGHEVGACGLWRKPRPDHR